MARIRYKAVDINGKIINGVMEAGSRADAVRTLMAQGIKPLRAVEEKPGLWAELTKERGVRKLSERDRVLFVRKLATLVSAGVTLEDALTINTKTRRATPSAALASRLLVRLRDGASLAQAMRLDGETFSDQYIAMIHAGEIGGALPKILNRLSDMLERAIETRETVRSAMIYPAILALTSAIAIATIFIFVLPSFEPMFDQAGANMPALTSIVMGMSRFMNQYGLFLLAGIALLGLLLARLYSYESIRLRWDTMIARSPLLGPFVQRADLSQTSAVLGALIVNGVSLDAALKLVEKLPVNRAFRHGLKKVHAEVVDGKRLSDSLESWSICPEIIPQLVRAGESTGSLGEMLRRASSVMEDEARRSVDRGMSMLTPILTLVLGGFVAVIVFSVLLAVLSVNDLAL